MQTVTIGTKNQIVIPKAVRKKTGLRAGMKVTIYALNDSTVTIKPTPDNWVERTSGIMREAWKGIDTTAELEKMRNEW